MAVNMLHVYECVLERMLHVKFHGNQMRTVVELHDRWYNRTDTEY